MAFYTFHQNNSAGFYIGPHYVIVEAENPQEANAIAQLKGIYFDGVAEGIDCSCCGDRWCKVYSYEKGTEQPEIYGKAPEAGENYVIIRKA